MSVETIFLSSWYIVGVLMTFCGIMESDFVKNRAVWQKIHDTKSQVHRKEYIFSTSAQHSPALSSTLQNSPALSSTLRNSPALSGTLHYPAVSRSRDHSQALSSVLQNSP